MVLRLKQIIKARWRPFWLQLKQQCSVRDAQSSRQQAQQQQQRAAAMAEQQQGLLLAQIRQAGQQQAQLKTAIAQLESAALTALRAGDETAARHLLLQLVQQEQQLEDSRKQQQQAHVLLTELQSVSSASAAQMPLDPLAELDYLTQTARIEHHLARLKALGVA